MDIKPHQANHRMPWLRMNRMEWVLVILVCGYAAISYPLEVHRIRPEESQDAALLYRGDPHYLPLIAFLSRGILGEATLHPDEREDRGLTSYPFLAIATHAAMFAVFGWVGIYMADALVYLAVVLVFRLFLRRLGIARWLATAAALALVGNVFALPDMLVRHMGWTARPVLQTYDWRIARPLVTDVFFFLTLLGVAAVFRPRPLPRSLAPWVLLGLGFATLVQGSFPQAAIMTLALPLAFLLAFLFRPGERSTLIRGGGVALICAVLASMPFFIQRLTEPEDLQIRLYLVMPEHVTSAWGLVEWHGGRLFAYITLCLVFLAWTGLSLRKRHAPSLAWRIRAVGFIPLYLILAYLGPALTLLAFGRTRQPADFYDAFLVAGSYWILLCGLFVGHDLWRRLSRPLRGRVAFCVLLLLVPICFFALHQRARKAAAWPSAVPYSVEFAPQVHQIPSYRTHFAELTAELRRPLYRNAKVLGTYDKQLFLWWVTFEGRYSLLVDPFSSVQSDADMEDRFVWLAKYLGADDSQFRELLYCGGKGLMTMWVGGAHYVAVDGLTRYPLESYSAADQERIRNSPVFSWRHALPEHEEARLFALFRERDVSENAPRLDLVVLPKVPFLDSLRPSGGYRKTFENAAFRVWLREESAGVSTAATGNSPARWIHDAKKPDSQSEYGKHVPPPDGCDVCACLRRDWNLPGGKLQESSGSSRPIAGGKRQEGILTCYGCAGL